jgi:UDPglucose 6-dehydrogenase
MRVAVVGTGHVGLITCASMASIGHEVVGTDADAVKIATIRDGAMPFHEPGLEDLVLEQVATGRLSFTERVELAVADADVVFICVGTPPRETGEANLVFVENAVRDVAIHARNRTLIVEKSTVPAGTAERIRRTVRLTKTNGESEIEVASNPEFLREGHAVRDALEPDRILVGAEAPWAFEMLRELYAPLVAAGVRMIETDIKTAELAKHASNAFLALKVSYANALARIAERAGADVGAIAHVMGADPRIGPEFLAAGLGYGGSCFPKDLVAFHHLASSLGYQFDLLREVQRINDEAIQAAVQKVRDALWNIEGKKIALLGLSFKPETDDIRFSPALALARSLLASGATVVAYDPQAAAASQAELPDLQLADNAYEAVRDAHCIVVCTAWDEFRDLDLEKLAELTAYQVIVDGRNLLNAEDVIAAGFSYYPTGRPPSQLSV